jgi:hypothetical protein
MEASVMEANNALPTEPVPDDQPPTGGQPQRKCPPHVWRVADGDRLDGDGFIVKICEICGVESRKAKVRRHPPKKVHRARH